MTDAFRELELGAKGLDYIKQRLAYGKSLAKLLLQYHELEAGRVITYLPPSIGIEAASDFESGGKLPPLFSSTSSSSRLEPVPNMDAFLAGEVQAFLNANDRNLCIFEDASAIPSDPFLQTVETRFAFFQDEVYHLLCQADKDEARILKTVRRAQSWLFIGAMTSGESAIDICGKKIIIKDELNLLAKAAEKIIIGAYDGEGYLIWSASSQSD